MRYTIFIHFSCQRDHIKSLEDKILKLQVDLSHANAKIFQLETVITKKKASSKSLMDRIHVLKKAERKRVTENQKKRIYMAHPVFQQMKSTK